jgi:hypothetical protein
MRQKLKAETLKLRDYRTTGLQDYGTADRGQRTAYAQRTEVGGQKSEDIQKAEG